MDVALQRMRRGRDGRSEMLTGLRGVGKTVPSVKTLSSSSWGIDKIPLPGGMTSCVRPFPTRRHPISHCPDQDLFDPDDRRGSRGRPERLLPAPYWPPSPIKHWPAVSVGRVLGP